MTRTRTLRGRGTVERDGEVVGEVVAMLQLAGDAGVGLTSWSGTLSGELPWGALLEANEGLVLRFHETDRRGSFFITTYRAGTRHVAIQGSGDAPG